MADNADRKPLFAYDGDDRDDAAYDPLMELSLIGGPYEGAPQDAPEQAAEPDREAGPASEPSPVAEAGSQIDLEEALEAELLPPSAAPSPDAQATSAPVAAEPPADSPAEIPAFLSGRSAPALSEPDRDDPAVEIGAAPELSASEAPLPIAPPTDDPTAIEDVAENATDPAGAEPSDMEGGSPIDAAAAEPVLGDDGVDSDDTATAAADEILDEESSAVMTASDQMGFDRAEVGARPADEQAPDFAAEPEDAPSEAETATPDAPSLEDELEALLLGPRPASVPSDDEPALPALARNPDLADHQASPDDDAPAEVETAFAGIEEPGDSSEPFSEVPPAPAADDQPEPDHDTLASDWSEIEAAWATSIDQIANPSDAARGDNDEPIATDRDDVGDGPIFSRATPVAPELAASRPADLRPQAAADEQDAEAAGALPVDPVDELDLEDDFIAAFDAELASGDLSIVEEPDTGEHDRDGVPATPSGELDGSIELDPVDELAAIMGLERGGDPDRPFVPAGSAALSVDGTDADGASSPTSEPDRPGASGEAVSAVPFQQAEQAAGGTAPVLDTVDMSGFEAAAADFEVPDFEAPSAAALDDGAFAGLEDELSNALEDDPFGRPAAGAAPAPAAALDEGAFDTAQFEAELARDMEFVGHDMEAARQPDGLDLDGGGRDETALPTGQDETGSGRRAMIIGAVVAGLALAGIGGVLALSGGDAALDDGPVLVEADPEPVKVEPDDPGGTTVPNQDRAVFAAGADAEPEQESLVTTAEEPVDIASAPADGLPSAVATGAAEKSEDRLTEGGTETTTQPAVAPITPRRVRTLVVRPDGTLEERAPAPQPASGAQTPALAAASEPTVSGEGASTSQSAQQILGEPETVAGLPVGTSAAEADDITQSTVAAQPAETDAAGAATGDRATSDPAERLVAEEPESEPVMVRRVQTTTATPAAIADRPADQPVSVVNRPQQTAAASATSAPEPAAQPVPPAPAPTVTNGSTGGFTVQLAALPSEAAARATATRLSQQYGSLIAGRGMTIQRAVIDGRGTFYRIRVAADGSGDANSLCNRIKASGGNCFVAR